MSKEEKKNTEGLSRREFLKDAGLVIGGTTIGSMAVLSACGGGGATQTVTKTSTITVTSPVVTKVVEATATGLITLNVNGQKYKIVVEPDWTLAWVLREKLGLFGLKEGCNMGECGTCTVVADKRSIYACLVLAVEAEGMNIETIEGLSNEIKLHPVQQAFEDYQASQCGYCTPGFIMTTKAFLDETPKPTLDEVREALSGHICFCGHIKRIVEAVYKGLAGGM